MCERLDSIRAVAKAADKLALACAVHGAVEFNPRAKPVARSLRKAFKTSLVTPLDMIEQLRKLK